MNEVVQLGTLPRSQLPNTTYEKASSYFEALADLYLLHLRSQRNEADISPDADADVLADGFRHKFVARFLFRKLVQDQKLRKQWIFYDDGPFHVWCDDFRPEIVLVDGDERIIGVVDWEFTYAAPVEFSHAASWGLLLRKPEVWPKGLDDWCVKYEKALHTFLVAMRKCEDEEIQKKLLVEAHPYVSPELAHQCLLSLLFDSRCAASFVTEVKKTMQWHSTIDTLKNPLSGYLSPAVDLLSSLDHLHGKALKKEFSSQFEFDTALQRLLASANDGHLGYSGCSQKIFQFTLNTPIASVSSDRLEIPEVYALDYVHLLGNHSDLVSPIVSINGKRAESYLENISHHQGYQDPDARYNQLFDSLTRVPETMTANRTEKKVNVKSVPLAQYKFNYTDSRVLFKDYCIPQPSSDDEDDEEEEETTAASLPASPFLPRRSDKGEGEPNNATKFIQEAKKAGKKKLIIDLSNNSGGFNASGMDLFKLFFPDKEIYSAARLRAHEALNIYGKVMSKIPRGSELAEAYDLTLSDLVTPNQTAFESWAEYYGPHELAQLNQTSLVSNLKLNDSNWDLVIRGYGIVK
ncbi:peptidase S41 family protein [Aspergillus affinis]|uniref:peptidase S41 family protein n=1 Tax=Aspergillus affinis TaxID=1070780 RepID=UPI0022FE6C65|nr:peptidase S41 family protein [Aspergillus affinis]KAI9045959.1 peptidase S41 family protein [Aspergillus affinis]